MTDEVRINKQGERYILRKSEVYNSFMTSSFLLDFRPFLRQTLKDVLSRTLDLRRKSGIPREERKAIKERIQTILVKKQSEKRTRRKNKKVA